MNFISITDNNWIEKWKAYYLSIFFFYEDNCKSCINFKQYLIENFNETIYIINWQENDELTDFFQLKNVPWICIVGNSKIYYESSWNYKNLKNFFNKWYILNK